MLVEEDIGKGYYLEGKPQTFQPVTDHWLYVFGGAPVLVRLSFNKGVCNSARSMIYNMDELYNKWRAESLRLYAIGKTVSQIAKFENQDGRHESKSGKAFAELIRSTDKGSRQFLLEGDEVVVYQFSHWLVVFLVLKNGSCTFAGQMASGAYLFGLTDCEILPEEASFRMPAATVGNH
jgi:hypothetical protein